MYQKKILITLATPNRRRQQSLEVIRTSSQPGLPRVVWISLARSGGRFRYPRFEREFWHPWSKCSSEGSISFSSLVAVAYGKCAAHFT
jgi:hypothetical protein